MCSARGITDGETEAKQRARALTTECQGQTENSDFLSPHEHLSLLLETPRCLQPTSCGRRPTAHTLCEPRVAFADTDLRAVFVA